MKKGSNAIDRPLWRGRIEQEWRERRVVWLAGPRRLGKTTLVRSLPDIDYFDCDLPSVRRDVGTAHGSRPAREGFRGLNEAFWARDILELFSIGKRYSFLRLLEMLWAQSGGLCELTSFTAGVDHPADTVDSFCGAAAPLRSGKARYSPQ